MDEKWIFSSTFLPYTDEPIEFMLEDRNQPMHGTFANGIFHSRWADYDADRVASWREADGDPSAAPIEVKKTSTTGMFIATLKRLTGVLSWQRPAVVPSEVRRSHARVIAAPTNAMCPIAATTRPINSNQISS